MRRKLNENRLRYVRLRKLRQKKSSEETSVWSLNGFLTTLISVVTLAVAIASYQIAKKQTDISDTLAALELAKNRPKFTVAVSGKASAFRQSGRLLYPQIPTTVTITPDAGVKDITAVTGQASIFFTEDGTERPCIVSIRGLFTQSTRDKVHLVKSTTKELQYLIDDAETLNLRAEGF